MVVFHVLGMPAGGAVDVVRAMALPLPVSVFWGTICFFDICIVTY